MAQGVRGTRDFYPEDMRIRNWLFDKFHNASKSHGFEEYDTPIVEYEELYTRKAGEDITQQLYNFEDKGGRKLSLRPEMTPSLARMIMAKAGTLPIPIKWYSIPQCWRYERSQRGRGREHYQWNVDIWGVSGVEAEAELFSILIHFFSDVGLTSNDLRIRISNRKILEELLNSLSITGSQFTQTCIVMDKMDKIPMEAITEQLSEIGINDEAISQILDCLNIKKLSNLATILGEDSTALTELNNLFTLIDSYKLNDWVEFDTSVVRGLAYYTGTVFEAYDKSRDLRAICGGGRYDKLIGTLGGNDMPATGFGFGDMVILELLKEKNLIPAPKSENQDIVFCLDQELRSAAMAVASKLRKSGRFVDLVIQNKKMKWAFKHAERSGAKRLIMIMPEEWNSGIVKIKELNTGEEIKVKFNDL